MGGYLTVALGVTMLWVHCARTEFDVDKQVLTGPDGQVYTLRFCSIVRLAQGRTLSPFVQRRLLVDLARCLAAVIPDRAWDPLRSLVRAAPQGPPLLRALIERQAWSPNDVPLLASAYVLIGCSVLGFLCTCRWLLRHLYEMPARLADLAAWLLGLALLGGYGDWHYSGYPYDFPQVFVFTLALATLVARSRWFPVIFCLAAYSKETSILLIAAYALLARNYCTQRFWVRIAFFTALFAVIRGWVALCYPAPQPPGGFWSLDRNLRLMGLMPFYCWALPFFVIGMMRLWALQRQFPTTLKRWSLLAIPLVGMALFKGWLEELRQYLELVPIFGPLALQWCLHEVGYGQLVRARDLRPMVGEQAEPRARAA
jgi:hypothetical protein